MDREAMWFLIVAVLAGCIASIGYNFQPRSEAEKKVDAYRECITRHSNIEPNIKVCEELTK